MQEGRGGRSRGDYDDDRKRRGQDHKEFDDGLPAPMDAFMAFTGGVDKMSYEQFGAGFR